MGSCIAALFYPYQNYKWATRTYLCSTETISIIVQMIDTLINVLCQSSGQTLPMYTVWLFVPDYMYVCSGRIPCHRTNSALKQTLWDILGTWCIAYTVWTFSYISISLYFDCADNNLVTRTMFWHSCKIWDEIKCLEFATCWLCAVASLLCENAINNWTTKPGLIQDTRRTNFSHRLDLSMSALRQNNENRSTKRISLRQQRFINQSLFNRDLPNFTVLATDEIQYERHSVGVGYHVMFLRQCDKKDE